MGTSAQEKETYQPSASREMVTVLGVPSTGRLHRPHGNASDLGEDAIPILELGAVAILLIGERVVAVPPMKAGETGFLAVRHAPEEGLIGLVQSSQHILQNMAIDGTVLGQVRAQGLEFRFLLIAREGHAALLPQIDTLLKGGVVERATAPQDRLKLARLRLAWASASPDRFCARFPR
jgi:hypothetical protein